MTAQEILTGITLAVSGWTLLEVISLGKTVAALKERTKNLTPEHETHT